MSVREKFYRNSVTKISLHYVDVKLKATMKGLLKRGIWILVGLVFLVIGFGFHFWKQTLAWYDGAGHLVRKIEYFPYRYKWDLFYWVIGTILLILGYSEFKSVKKTMLEKNIHWGYGH